MTGNFKFTTVYDINSPIYSRWFLRNKNIGFVTIGTKEKNLQKYRGFFGLIGYNRILNFINVEKQNKDGLNIKTQLTKEFDTSNADISNCTIELPTDRLRKPNIEEYILLGTLFKKLELIYNKKKDTFIEKQIN